jgi:hypothetical protein
VDEQDTITIHRGMGKVVSTLGELKAEVYPNLTINEVRPKWLAERAILSPLNTNVNQLNNWLIEEFPGDERIYNVTRKQ